MSADREKITKRRKRRRRRRFKTSFKVFLGVFSLMVLGGSYAGFMYYHNLHAPDPNGKLQDIQAPETNNFDLSDEVMPNASYWVLDVGKGEAIYIKSGETDILLDAGPEEDAKAITNAISKNITGTLDYFFITSDTQGRTGGFEIICKELKPDKIITCPLGENAAKYKKAAGDIPIEEGKDTTISLGENSSLTVFRPEVSSKDPRDQSLMTLFKYGATTFFAESDAGEEEEARVMESVAGCNALVLARSGSDSANQHIEELQANIFVVSDAKGGGPDESILEKTKAKIYTTYNSGTIKFTTDGKEVTSNLKPEDAVGATGF